MRHSLRVCAPLAVILAGCAGHGDPSAPRTPQLTVGAPLTVTPLGSNGLPLAYYSGITDAQRVVVRDLGTWQAEWTAISGPGGAAPGLPAVDFSREMVVVAALGQRNTGGYVIHIDSAAATTSGGAVVWVRSVSPGRSCGTTQALTQPVDAARLPRVTGAVTFQEQTQTADCQ